jgi:hypothetical protein
MKTFTLFILLAVTSCAHYYPVAVPADAEIDVWEVSQALDRSQRLISVRPCQQTDQTDFDTPLAELNGCIVATTKETSDCPERYQYLMWKEQGQYLTHQFALVTLCVR